MVIKRNHPESGKSGIALIGSVIVDELVPLLELGQLSYVDAAEFVSEQELKGEHPTFSVGGMALNVAVDLSKMGKGYRIAVFGKVGEDQQADLIRSTLFTHHIDHHGLVVTPKYETSRTEVLHIRMANGSIDRIFRHVLGAMGSFNENDLRLEDLSSYKIAAFGYGLLLPQLDLIDEVYGTKLGKLLADVQRMSVMTALDFVSPNQENMFKFMRYKKSLPFVDICCINEDQACALTEKNDPGAACMSLVDDFGVKISAVHCGAKGPNFTYSKEIGLISQPNYIVPESEYKGNAGAGDAFFAGFLHGIHRQWPIERATQFAAAAAAVSLGDASCTGAMRDEKYILEYAENRKMRS
ncbi:MAG: carbohydrate kinase family protein [Calditrichaeota bacterium]|nr:carbohydrate kinase family protein [Calditrichota bacterium]